ncbi:hypothetical protein [Actinomycetospora lutea]|uniref:hypothetical protein n=1 Tax=Actinomycetospora lutea TaxID=663604 RepID=UPI003B6796B4
MPFVLLGALLGTVLGGSQALSRSLFSQLIPHGDHLADRLLRDRVRCGGRGPQGRPGCRQHTPARPVAVRCWRAPGPAHTSPGTSRRLSWSSSARPVRRTPPALACRRASRRAAGQGPSTPTSATGDPPSDRHDEMHSRAHIIDEWSVRCREP